ncbi:MAG: hypothetical protein R6U17_01560 [Thermoplasmata archaeon]
MDKKKFGMDNVFESMEYFTSRAVKDMLKTVENQQKSMEEWFSVSTDLGEDVKELLEETNEGYEKLAEDWEKIGDIVGDEGISEEDLGRKMQQEFIEYNEKVSDLLENMTDTGFESYRQLYSSWTSLYESFLTGLKAGTGPNPEEVMDAFADFHQTSVHVALRELENNREDMEELRETLEEFGERTTKRLTEAAETGNKKYMEYIKEWQKKVKDMETRVEDQLKTFEKRYTSYMKPYFHRPTVMPFFPWLSGRRLRDYEYDIESLKKRIKELEEKLEEKG